MLIVKFRFPVLSRLFINNSSSYFFFFTIRIFKFTFKRIATKRNISGAQILSKIMLVFESISPILYFAGGFIGTGHHWYWTGQTSFNMALSALFSALEVVPLTLITLDAWDFVKLSKPQSGLTKKLVEVPHKWTFYFLMAVGFWNFVGAGIFGFLINLPVVSYFETGTLLTINHGHAAMVGVFGMLGIGLIVFAIRQSTDEVLWHDLEKYVRTSFWGLNGGLLMMVVLSLFPAGILQLIDVLNNGYWHARSLAYTGGHLARTLEWCRFPGDLVFIIFGVVPITIAASRAYLAGMKTISVANNKL